MHYFMFLCITTIPVQVICVIIEGILLLFNLLELFIADLLLLGLQL